jgi:hypothetical protein
MDLSNKSYNPYTALRDENKKLAEKEQTLKKLQDIKAVESQQNGDKLIAGIREKIFSYFNNVHLRDKAAVEIKNLQSKLGLFNQI